MARVLVAAALAEMLWVTVFVARTELRPGPTLRAATAGVTSGDEPHYLLILNSILRDGDLQLEADYRRVAAGGGDAGMRFRGVHLDHHTILVDRESGAHALEIRSATLAELTTAQLVLGRLTWLSSRSRKSSWSEC